MIEQFKMGLKLLRYAYGGVSCTIFMGIFLVLGILIGCLTTRLGMSSSMLIIVAGMWIMQLLYSLGVSKLIKTSARARQIETSMTAICNAVFTVGFYFVILVIKLCWLRGADEKQMAYMSIELILIGFFIILLMVSMATAYKYFWGTMLIFWMGCMVMGGMPQIVEEFSLKITFGIHFGLAAVIGLAEIFIGALLQYGISVLVYKHPASKWAQLNALSKQM